MSVASALTRHRRLLALAAAAGLALAVLAAVLLARGSGLGTRISDTRDVLELRVEFQGKYRDFGWSHE
jgi:hypothetical protein